MVNNETLQDDYELMQKETTTGTDVEFKPLSIEDLSNFYEEIEEGRRKLYAWLSGVELVCDKDLPDSYWNIHCGKKLYQEVMDYARAVRSNE